MFHIPDGGSIRVHSKWDGKDQIFKCRYVGSHHVEVSGNCYHICQFAEMMERNGNTYAPVKEIGDLDFYEKYFYDRDNVGSDGKPFPYYSLIEKVADKGMSSEMKTTYAFCLNPASPEKAFCKVELYSYIPEATKVFGPDIEMLCDDMATCDRVRNIVAAIKEAQSKDSPSLDEILEDAEKRKPHPGPGGPGDNEKAKELPKAPKQNER